MPFFFSILVQVLVMALIYWVLTLLPLPDLFMKVAKVILLVICLLYLLSLFGMVPLNPIWRR